MIVECPRCGTALSKGEQELASGAPVHCPHCGNEFPPPARPGASGPVPVPPAAAGAESASTSATAPTPARGPATDTAPFPMPGQRAVAEEPLTPVATPIPPSRGRAIDDTTGIMGYADPSGAHAVVAQPRGTGPSEWTNVKTEILGPGGPTTGLGRPTGAPTRRLTQPGATGNRFPSASGSRFVSDVLSWVRLLPWRQKVLLAVAVLVPVLILVGVVALASPEHGTRYSLELQPFMEGAGTTEYYPQLGWLERGGRVELVRRAGDWSLVVDELGRSGYVGAQAIRKEPPPAVPSKPFADCLRAPQDINGDRCHARADTQLDSCRGSCGGSADDPSCLEHCQKRFTDCLAVCEKPAGPVTLPAPPAAAVETARPRAREPAAEAPKAKKPATPAKPAPAPAKTKKKTTTH